MSHSSTPAESAAETIARQSERIDELEVRMAFLEDTVDVLNQQLAASTQEFALARQAMQMMHQRLEQMQSSQSLMKDFSEETPPPHY